jgi:hypothetical protein
VLCASATALLREEGRLSYTDLMVRAEHGVLRKVASAACGVDLGVPDLVVGELLDIDEIVVVLVWCAARLR